MYETQKLYVGHNTSDSISINSEERDTIFRGSLYTLHWRRRLHALCSNFCGQPVRRRLAGGEECQELFLQLVVFEHRGWWPFGNFLPNIYPGN